MNGGRERMAKRLLGRYRPMWQWCRRVWQRMSCLGRMVAISLLAVFLSLLAWAVFSGELLWRLTAGVVALFGLVVAKRRADAMANTAKAAEAGNRQRAFKDGLEHLGNDKSSVRQGGAHALFHLALEDEKLRASIADVLCAHIWETTGDKDYQEQNKDKPSAEMQSLLRLLFTTEIVDERRVGRFWEGITPDLNGGYFRGVELEGARFQGAKLNSAQFQEASLGEANFRGASLREAQFQGADLDRAQFQWASLEKAQFHRASLVEAQFHRASLVEAQFQRASLVEAQFQRASLRRAQFQGALLEAAQFQRASLAGAQFQRTSLWAAQFQRASLEVTQFQGASLGGAQFQGASLEGAQFQGASLEGARFQGASLEGAQFQGAGLDRAQFQGAGLDRAQFQGARLSGSQFQGAWLYMAGFQQAKFGQGSEREGIPAQDHTVAKPDELVEKLKASAFHGASSKRYVRTKFERRINDRTDKESDFFKAIFAGGMTEELLEEIKGSLEFLVDQGSQFFDTFDDPDSKEILIRNLESEIGQPESRTPPKEVIAGSYRKEDAERWIREFREAMETVPETNQAA